MLKWIYKLGETDFFMERGKSDPPDRICVHVCRQESFCIAISNLQLAQLQNTLKAVKGTEPP